MRTPAAVDAVALSVLLAASAVTPAYAQPSALNRCIDAEGNAVYTDRTCESLDTRPVRTAPVDPDTRPANTPVARDCARTPAALVIAVEEALASADGNRLAALYDWRGRSGSSANAVMPRLEAIASARAIEVRTAHSAEGSDDAELAVEAAAVPPDRLRIVHAPDGLGAGDIAEFRLVRAAGCWWFAD
jgi:hypothetical protein